MLGFANDIQLSKRYLYGNRHYVVLSSRLQNKYNLAQLKEYAQYLEIDVSELEYIDNKKLYLSVLISNVIRDMPQ